MAQRAKTTKTPVAPKKTPTRPKPKATQARTLLTHQRIMSAAVKEFSRHGFGGASLRAIARRARVPDMLIHYHFGGKEKLWREVVTSLFDGHA